MERLHQFRQIFCRGRNEFFKNHTPNTADGERWDYLYDLPDVPEDDGTDETGTVLTEEISPTSCTQTTRF
ncbi:MAG: hypothetical protein ACLSFT_06740 [Ruminococcus callidus]